MNKVKQRKSCNNKQQKKDPQNHCFWYLKGTKRYCNFSLEDRNCYLNFYLSSREKESNYDKQSRKTTKPIMHQQKSHAWSYNDDCELLAG